MACWKSATLLLTVFISTGFCYRHISPHIYEDKPLKVYPKINEKPLILTPYLQNNKIDEARRLSQVHPPLAGNVTSYTGFFTVNKIYNSNLFFWFVPAEIQTNKAPVAVWLQGGPGSSSLFGLFGENGPFEVEENLSVTLREHRWSKRISMLYIDNPIGAGFSFTDLPNGYSRSQDEVAQNLRHALQQFFKLFPEYQKNDFFLIGEEYGSKYVSVLASVIYNENKSSPLPPLINLKGIAIGNGLCDPAHMLNFGDLLYQIGLVDSNGKRFFDDEEEKARFLIRSGKYSEANQVINALIGSHFPDRPSNFTQITGYIDYFNLLNPNRPAYEPIPDFLHQPSIRKQIHVGDAQYNYSSQQVRSHLPNGDKMQSDVHYLQTLVEHYRFLFYNGQLNVIRGYAAFQNFLKNFEWSGAAEFHAAPRHFWKVENEIAGYHKTAKTVTEVMVRNAGFNTATDQPSFAYHMINRFIFGEPF